MLSAPFCPLVQSNMIGCHYSYGDWVSLSRWLLHYIGTAITRRPPQPAAAARASSPLDRHHHRHA